MPLSLPPGRYLSAMGAVRADKGGQTGAMLLRSRAVGAALGAPVDVVCFDHSRNYPEIRARLQETGQLRDGMRLLNLFEHYRDHGWPASDGADGSRTGDGAWAPPAGLRAEQVTQADGSPWRLSYRDPSGTVVLNDFQRRDGTVFLRGPAYRITDAVKATGAWTRYDAAGQVLGADTDARLLFHRFLSDLTVADARTFLFVDSRYLAPLLAPVDDPSMHLIYLLHNCHLPAPRRWDTPVTGEYARLLDRIDDLDAFVTLTRRQADDIQRRYGPRPNVFVVPNPVDPPVVPDPLPPRDPLLVGVVARLERQKRLRHAVLVMEKVALRVPGARLDIYGSGSQRDMLQELIDRRGLAATVRLRGHDPTAREALWRSSAFLLTSENEGYPLATLESLARGCPVVSYDIPYGPADQLTDGHDGFLVEAEDIAAAARRIVRLLRSPELVQTMGAAARETAAAHGLDRFRQDWAAVLHAVVEQSTHRVRLQDVSADVVVRPSGRIHRRVRGRSRVSVSAELRFRAGGPGADRADAVVELVAVGSVSGDTAALPVRTTDDGTLVRLTAVVDPDQVFGALTTASRASVELRLRWHNAYWATALSTADVRSAEALPAFADGRLRLNAPRIETRSASTLALLRRLRRSARRRTRRVARAVSRRLRHGRSNS